MASQSARLLRKYMINEQSQEKREMTANQITCPECGPNGKTKLVQYQVNAEGLIPCMCKKCGERWYWKKAEIKTCALEFGGYACTCGSHTNGLQEPT